MAQYRATMNTNWSTLANWQTWNGSAWVAASVLPGSADDVFANNFTVTIDQDITVLTLRNTNTGASGTGTNNGGGFVIDAARTVTVSQNITQTMVGATNLLTISHTSGTVNLTMTSQWTANGGNGRVIQISSTSTTNLTGSFRCGSNSQIGIQISGAGTVNLVGGVEVSSYTPTVITIDIIAACTLNITGNVTPPTGTAQTSSRAIRCSTGSNGFNITVNGNVSWLDNSNANNTNIDISIVNTQTFSGNLTINGVCGGGTVWAQHIAVVATGSLTLTHNGVCQGGIAGSAGSGSSAIFSTTGSPISILSGPFIFGNYGAQPFVCSRIFLKDNVSKYIEFASDSTGGALFPSPPPTRSTMYSPNVVADSPAASNVRNGVVYANGSLTGTLKVPNPNQVAVGVETDNTVGTAVITKEAVKEAVWDALLADITTPNSIGVRLKNAATVESTGDQIAALINT